MVNMHRDHPLHGCISSSISKIDCNNLPLMSLVLWYDSKPFYFRIFSISALTLTYYDAWNQRDASHDLCVPSMLNFC